MDFSIPAYRTDAQTPDLYVVDVNNDGVAQREETFRSSETTIAADARKVLQRLGLDDYRAKLARGEDDAVQIFGSQFALKPHAQQRVQELKEQLEQDVAELRAMPQSEKPPEYVELQGALEAMLDILPHTHFQYVENMSAEYGAFYRPNLNTIFIPGAEELPSQAGGNQGGMTFGSKHAPARDRVPDVVLVHELDHALTSKTRVEPFGGSFISTLNGRRHVVTDSVHPPPDKAKTMFDVKLDHQSGSEKIRYNSFDAYLPALAALSLPSSLTADVLAGRRVMCTNDQVRMAAGADEIQAYETQARYIAFRIGLKAADLSKLANGDRAALQKMSEGVQALVGDSSYSALEATRVMHAHFEINGGLSNYVYGNEATKRQSDFSSLPDCIPLERGEHHKQWQKVHALQDQRDAQARAGGVRHDGEPNAPAR